MAKVTIIIEPEDAHEGTYGHTTVVMKEDVITTEDLECIFQSAAAGGGWLVDEVYLGSIRF